MATNTSATSQNHNGTGSQANFAISFPFLLNSEIEVTVGGVLKTLGTHYNIVGSEVQFTSGNIPASGTANIVFNRDTNISTKRVDFEDGSVLTEADLDNNVNQVLFAQQELSNDYVKRDGTQTVTGNLVFEGSADDANETTLAITNPTADRTITVPDRTGTIITSGDTGTVTNTMLAGNSVDSSKIIDGSIVNADVNASAAIAQSKLNIANATTSAAGYQSAADKTKLDGIEPNATQDQTASEIRTLIASDPLTATHLAANSVDSSELVDGSVDHSHLSNDCVDGDNVQDDSIDSEHIVAGSLDNEHYAAGSITSDKLNGATVITSSEQGSATTNDTSFLTSAAADARFFNISSGDTIKDGQTFPDNDTTIATTAAINDRIIDLIDDVGGFTIIASEQAFPNVNPQGVTGQAAVLSIKAATTNLVPSGTTVTVVNGNVANNANITITGVPSTIPSGFGFLVESTTTLHTYSFHRLVPKATEVTTVAGKAVEIGRLGTADAVADMAILGTTDVVADMNTLATADIVSDMNTLATTDVVNDMNTLAVTSVINNMDTVATNVTNVNNVGNNITNVNNLTNSTGANQTFTVTVQNVSGNKYFIDGVQTPVLKLARGKTYTFNLADSSNSGHPLAFRDSSDNSYTTGVTTSGTAGSSGATVVIVVAANAPSSLKYYCTSHGNAMGNTINVIDDNVGAVAGALTNVNLVGGSITNVNNVGNSISNVNTVASNISSVNSFFNLYRIGSSNPTSSLDTGDLFFNTSTNSLKVYTGSAWVDGVTTTGDFALKTGNTFTGSNIHNDNVKSIYGTGSDFEIFHNGSGRNIIGNNATQIRLITDTLRMATYTGDEIYLLGDLNGSVDLYYDNSKKFETTSSGATVSGQLTAGTSGGQNPTGTSWATNSAINLYGSYGGGIAFNDNGNNGFVQYVESSGTIFNLKTGAVGGSLEQVIRAVKDGKIELYHNNQKHLQTSGNGVDIFGGIATNFVNLWLYTTDGDKRGGIYADNSELVGFVDDQNHFLAFGKRNEYFILRYDQSTKLETTATGVTITGSLVLTDDLDMGDNDKLLLGDSDDLQIYHTGGNNYVGAATNQPLLFFTNNTSRWVVQSDGHFRPNLDSTYDIGSNTIRVRNGYFDTLYGDGSNLTGINTDLVSDTSPQLGGNLSTNGQAIHVLDNDRIYVGSGYDMEIYHDGSANYIRGGSYNIDIRAVDGEQSIVAKAHNAVELYYDGSKKFTTTSDGVDFGTAGADHTLAVSGQTVHRMGTQGSGIHFTNNAIVPTNSSGTVSNNTVDFGSSSYRWKNIYTNDLNLSNEGSSNDVDGTWGSYTIQEGAEDLYLINKRNGKKYKFNLTEVS